MKDNNGRVDGLRWENVIGFFFFFFAIQNFCVNTYVCLIARFITEFTTLVYGLGLMFTVDTFFCVPFRFYALNFILRHTTPATSIKARGSFRNRPFFAFSAFIVYAMRPLSVHLAAAVAAARSYVFTRSAGFQSERAFSFRDECRRRRLRFRLNAKYEYFFRFVRGHLMVTRGTLTPRMRGKN